MEIEADYRPKADGRPEPFFGIRLYPETNDEISSIEHGLSVLPKVDYIKRITQGKFHYLIVFKECEELK